MRARGWLRGSVISRCSLQRLRLEHWWFGSPGDPCTHLTFGFT
jgi:hypothetical protein